MATESEVNKQIEKNEKLQAQIQQLETEASTRFREADNEIQLARLKQDESRLQTELEKLKENASASAIKSAVKGQLGQIEGGADAPNLDAQVAKSEKE